MTCLVKYHTTFNNPFTFKGFLADIYLTRRTIVFYFEADIFISVWLIEILALKSINSFTSNGINSFTVVVFYRCYSFFQSKSTIWQRLFFLKKVKIEILCLTFFQFPDIKSCLNFTFDIKISNIGIC